MPARLWDALIAAMTTLAGVVIPLELVIGLQMPAGFVVFEWVLTVVFAADLVVRLRQARQSRHGAHRRSHTYTWAVIDSIAAFPFFLFPLPPVAHLFRFFKFGRLMQAMRTYWMHNIHQSLVIRLVLFSYWLVLATHWSSCVWLMIRGMDPRTDVETSYIGSLYFCISTVSTVGFGDITPTTNAERLFVIGMMLLGVGVYGFAIGNVASMLTRIDPARAHYIENMEKLAAFMRYKAVPEDLRRRMTDFYTYLWEKRLGYDEAAILMSLPPSLRTEVSLFLKRDVIQRVPLFKDAGEAFVRDIALQMLPVVFLPGDFVCRAGEPGNTMYFVSRGELEVLSKDGKTVLALLRDGDFFGEIALILNQPRSASVRARTYCDLYALDRPLLQRVLANYPDVASKIEARARERSLRE